MRIEWRNTNDEDDAILAVQEDSNTVVKAWEADPDLLTDFLNDMVTLDTHDGEGSVEAGRRDPQEWGGLVVARADTGEILSFDPELYWDRILFWFRSRGRDPHTWRASRR